MSGNNQPNLAGWAGILTAIAAIITAIGFSDFFPDLVKQLLGQNNSNSIITNQNRDLSNEPSLEPNNSEQTQKSPISLKEKTTDNNKFAVVNNIRFDLDNCQQSHQSIKCTISATNQTFDQKVRFFVSSASINIDGELYRAESAGLAGNTSPTTYSLEMYLAQDVPIKFYLNFEGIRSSVSNIKMLQIGLSKKPIQIKDIDIRLSQ